jgi:MFS family permease
VKRAVGVPDAMGSIKRFLYVPKNTWALESTSALWSVGQSMVSPFQALYFVALGATPFMIGLLIGYSTAVGIVAAIIGGYIADTLGRRRLIIAFSWVSVLGGFLYLLIDSSDLILIPLTLTSLGNIYTPAFGSIVMDEIEPHDRIRAFSVYNAIGAIPTMFSPTIGGLLINSFGPLQGIKFAYLGATVFGIAGISLRTLMLKEVFVARPLVRRGIKGYVSDPFVAGLKAARHSNRVVKRLLLYVALAGAGTGLTSTLVPVFVVNHLGIDPTSYSFVVDAAGFVTFSLYLATIFLVKRIGVRKSMLLASVAAPIGTVVLTQARTTDQLLGWGLGGAVNTALQASTLPTMQADAIPREDRGKVLALFGIIPSAAALPSQVLAGWLYTNTSPLVPFLLSLIPFDVAAIVLFSIDWTRRRPARSALAPVEGS